MRIFVVRIIYFLLFAFTVLALLELVVPKNWVTHRIWEAERVINGDLFVGSFYPNRKFVRDEYGDLAHHTEYSILKQKNQWQTDKLGFRNEHFIKQAEILIIGESNIVGSAVSQEKILSSRVESLSGFTTYNMSPVSFKQLVELLDHGVIEKPKIVVWGLIEREIPHLKKFQEKTSKKKRYKLITNGLYISLAKTYDLILKRSLQHYTTARLNDSKGKGFQSPIKSDVFFLQGKNSFIETNDSIIKSRVEIIYSYKEFCESHGMQFVFLPIPNKETVYYNLVPFDSRPEYYSELINELNNKGVAVIDALSLYESVGSNEKLYHNDDSHWNAEGINIVAKELSVLAKGMLEEN